MSISDLTGTTWLLNDQLTINTTADYNVIFTDANNYTYWALKLTNNSLGYMDYDEDDDPYTINVYTNGTWTNTRYKTITFENGQGSSLDLQNPNLIAWLQANATQVVEPSASMSIGTNSISKMLFGNAEVSKVFLGSVKVYEKSTPVPTLINFYIDDQSTTAEQGMSWLQWVSSNYNTEGYICNGDYDLVHNAYFTKKVVLSNVDIEGRNIIIENAEYDLVRDNG